MPQKESEYGIDWALTVTLAPRLISLYTAEAQYEKTRDSFNALLRGLGAYHTTVLELTKAFNVHYHSQMKLPKGLKNPLKRVTDLFRLSKSFGNIMMKPVTSTGWLDEYIQEDIVFTKGLIDIPGFQPVINDDYGILDKPQLKIPIEQWEPTIIKNNYRYIDKQYVPYLISTTDYANTKIYDGPIDYDSYDDEDVAPSLSGDEDEGMAGHHSLE